MDISHTPPSRRFYATGGGAGLSSDHPCRHGNPAISLHLTSNRDGSAEDIGILLPSCMAPQLFGAALAFIQVYSGSDAADEFVTSMLAFRDRALPAVAENRAELRAQGRGCCEAGFRTGGREHTCGRNTTSSS